MQGVWVLAHDILAIIGGCTVIGVLGIGLGLLLDHPAIVQDAPEGWEEER